ncbi:FimB/Mfa2 family fimbrial subunit [Bacteroides sp. 51]|nr:FimB/Mfa2 family fimbrial subunit [Bacteroides sp. 51]
MRNPLYNEQQDLDKHDTYELEFTLEHNGDEDTWAVVGIRVDDWTWSSSGTGL